MLRTLSLFLLVISIIIAIVGTRADAQNNYLYGTGNPAWGVNIPIENGFINVANGNVHMEIPIGNQPQRGGLPLTETVVYDSRIWQIVFTGVTYSFQPVPGGGWTFGGTAYGSLGTQENDVNESVPCSGSGGNQGYLQSTYTWTDMSGTAHLFAPGVYSLYDPICPNGNTGNINNSATGTAYSVDGDGDYLVVSQDASGDGYWTVFDQNGNSPTSLEDRNGNYVGLVYTEPQDTNVWTWTDTRGNTSFVETEENSSTTYLDVITIGGATKRYTVNWENINVNTDFGQSGTTDYSQPISVVQSLSLPDGSAYTFNYDSGTSSGHYGELTSMTLPTGGTVTFTYENYLDSYQNENRWLYTYSGGNGNYTFAPSVVTQCSGSTAVGCQEQMTVSDGHQNQLVYLFTLNNGAWNSQTDYYNYANGSLSHVLSSTTSYNMQNSCAESICGGGAEWITASSTTTTLSDTGQTTTTNYVYNNPQYGKPNKVQTWDYSTPANCAGGSTPTKETDYTYGYLVNGAAYVTQMNQLDCNGNIAAQSTFNYDIGTPTQTSGLPYHSTNYVFIDELSGSLITLPMGAIGNRGNLTSVVSGGRFGVATSSTYDDAGAKLSDTDANQNQILYTTMCSDSFPSGVTYPIMVNGTSLQSSMVYDCSSGLVTSTKDMNGQPSTYSYFMSGSNLGRLQTVTRPDNGTTTFAYPSTTETDQTIAQTSSVNETHKAILDSYGRKYQSVTLAPEGLISTETAYDATGRPYDVTTSHLEGSSSSTDGSTFAYYDVLGRINQIVASDGTKATAQYTGNSQTITDALSNEELYTYDAFHRLVSVLEPNSSDALANETDYQYNALNKLIQVDQWGGPPNSISPGDRQRVLTYDSLGLGRLVSLTTPEAGTTTFTYDANGNVITKTNARGVTTQYVYDALNRVRSKSYLNDSSATPISCFQYDTSTVPGAGGNLLGRLTNQWTQSAITGACSTSMLTSGGYLTLQAILSYDAVGRPKSEQQCTPSNCTSTTPYVQSYSYDLAGDLTSYTNGLAATPGAGSDPLTFIQFFDSAGRLQTISSTWNDTTHPATLFSSPIYAPPGALTTAIYGNGVMLNRTYNSQLLPTSESDTVNGASAATSGSATVTVTGAEQNK